MLGHPGHRGGQHLQQERHGRPLQARRQAHGVDGREHVRRDGQGRGEAAPGPHAGHHAAPRPGPHAPDAGRRHGRRRRARAPAHRADAGRRLARGSGAGLQDRVLRRPGEGAHHALGIVRDVYRVRHQAGGQGDELRDVQRRGRRDAGHADAARLVPDADRVPRVPRHGPVGGRVLPAVLGPGRRAQGEAGLRHDSLRRRHGQQVARRGRGRRGPARRPRGRPLHLPQRAGGPAPFERRRRHHVPARRGRGGRDPRRDDDDDDAGRRREGDLRARGDAAGHAAETEGPGRARARQGDVARRPLRHRQRQGADGPVGRRAEARGGAAGEDAEVITGPLHS
mmetsp:Transcript_35233/g.109234  ORF Transcript_35233/g.109234 Transcript_35233/m.109234 type:complete len:339 (+) Transcript_35233:294-1310(+)